MKHNSLKHALGSIGMFFVCSIGGAAPWEGFYGGVSVGHASTDTDEIESRLGSFKGDGSGALGGVQVGYNFRLTPTFVVGFQNDFYSTRIKAGSDGLFSPQVKIPLLATGRLRGGSLLFNERLFLYGTGGVALGQVDDSGEKKTKYGATFGAGAEWAWSPVLSTNVEVLATRLSKNWSKDDSANTDIKFKTITVGLNYHF